MARATLCLLIAGLAMAGAAPAAPAQLPVPVPPEEEDPLLPPAGRCRGDANPDAHHRTQRLAMHCLLGHVRREAGLPHLRSSVELRHSAIYKARRIAACRVFTHNPCGDRLDRPFKEAQLTRRGRWIVGEDLAWGVGPTATARGILARWMRSPSHRRVVLDRRFTNVGVRRRRLRMRGAPVGAVIWVAHLGRPARG